jgi:hypothetical protein
VLIMALRGRGYWWEFLGAADGLVLDDGGSRCQP